MAGKYTSLTPYSYCANNSVNLVDPNGKEWRDKNNTITVSLNLTNSAGINISLLDQYKNEISMYFNEVITTASRGKYSGEVIFYENNREIEQTLDLGTFNDNSIGGSTTRMFSIVNVHNKEGELLSVTSLAQSAVHELFHTLRLDHPFEMTQTKDTELIRIGINTYISTKNTDPQIINNIMNYPNIIIDGQKGSTMNLLTPGQFNFIRKEIQLQEMGYGLIKGSYLKHYEKYWNNWPGTRVGSL